MRLANSNDILKLSDIRVKQQKDDWQEEYEDKFDLLNSTRTYLEEHLNKDLYIFVEEIDTKIIATCGIQIIKYLPQCNDNGKQGYICNVYTEEQYRNKGIQTSLIQEVIKFAKKNDLCELNLSTDNEKAIRIYKKLGFSFDELIMTLDISK